MPVVKATIKDIVKAPVGEGTVTYVSYDIRAAAEGGSVITAPGSWAQPIVNGVALTPSLDPGLYEVEISIGWFVEKYNIVVPATETEQQLKTLIDEFIALPPDTPAVRLAAAIGSYFAENPVEGAGPSQENVAPLITSSGATRTAVDSRVQTVGDTRYAPAEGIAKAAFDAAVQAVLDRAGIVAPEFVTLVVRPTPGAGEYASPKLANDAITDASPLKRYEVIVNPGTYSAEVNWVVKPYVTIIGTDRTRCIIKGELPASSTDTQIAAASTLWLRGTAGLKNLTITARNMRYPVHSEDNGLNTDAVHTVENCWIEHFGNDDVAAYRTANSQPAGSPWSAIFAWGYGSASGVVEKFTDTTFVSLGVPFLVHNNAGFTKPNVNEFDRCRFIKARPRTVGPIQSSDAIISLQGLGSGVRDKLTIGRSEIAQSFVCELDSPWIPTSAAGQYANHSDFDVSISDSLIGFQTYNRGKALRINSAGATTSTVRLSGSAVPILFGDPIYFDGADILKGYAYGRLDISGILVGINADQTVANTIGRRLGDCTSAPKALTITFQSGTSVTHTFDQNYTAVANADILTALNTTIGANGSAAEYLVSQGETYPNFLDRQRTLRNTGTISIIRWSAVKFVAGAVQVMGTSDPASLFAGVAVDPIPVGKTGRILTEGLLIGTQLRFGPTITEGSPTYLSDATAGAFSATGTRAVGIGHSSGFLYFKGAVS